MIDPISEDLIDLREAAKLPLFRQKDGRPACFSTLWRWTSRGARAANGDRVRLECVRTPGGLRTTVDAIRRFIEALTNPDQPRPTAGENRRQQDRVAAARRELAAAGIK